MTEMKLTNKINKLIEEDTLTASKIQRRFDVDYPFAVSVIEKLASEGLVLEFDRKVKILKKGKSEQIFNVLLDAFSDKLQSDQQVSGNAKKISEIKSVSLEDLEKEIIPHIKKRGSASTAFVQRTLNIGYSRAAMVMDRLIEKGVISADDGYKYIGKD